MVGAHPDDILNAILSRLPGISLRGKPRQGYVEGTAAGWNGWHGELDIQGDFAFQESDLGALCEEFPRRTSERIPWYALCIVDNEGDLAKKDLMTFKKEMERKGYIDSLLTTFDFIEKNQSGNQIRTTNRTVDELDNIIKMLGTLREIIEVSGRAGIGHNGPPEAIDPPPLNIKDVDATIDTANIYRAMLSDKNIDRNQHIIDGFETLFTGFGKKLFRFIAWLEKFPSAVWDAVVQKSPEWFAKSLFWVPSLALAQELLQMLLQK